jgi:hypothetical protein
MLYVDVDRNEHRQKKDNKPDAEQDFRHGKSSRVPTTGLDISVTDSGDRDDAVVEKIEVGQRGGVRNDESFPLACLLETVENRGKAYDSPNKLDQSTDDLLSHLADIGDVDHASLLSQFFVPEDGQEYIAGQNENIKQSNNDSEDSKELQREIKENDGHYPEQKKMTSDGRTLSQLVGYPELQN